MKVSTYSVAWAIALTLCLSTSTTNGEKASSRRRSRRTKVKTEQQDERNLIFASLVNHDIPNPDDPSLRIELAEDNIPIIGEMFQAPATEVPSTYYAYYGTKGGGGNRRGNRNGNRRNGNNRNGNEYYKGNKGGGGNRNGNNRNNGSKGKGGKGSKGSGGSSGFRYDTSSCRRICANAESPRAPVCDADNMVSWNVEADRDCCCSGGVSYLKLSFSTKFMSDKSTQGTFSILGSADNMGEEIVSVAGAESPGRDNFGERPELPDETVVKMDRGRNSRYDCDDDETLVKMDRGGRNLKRKKKFQLKGRQAMFDTDNIRIVDCSDRCLINPIDDVTCQSAFSTTQEVSDNSMICFLQVAEDGTPMFGTKFPTNLKFAFTTDDESYVGTIHTSCSNPVVYPWAVVATPEDDPVSFATPIKSDQPQDQFQYPVFVFEGGVSTGFYNDARRNPYSEAGYQLDLGQCGCDCTQTFPPTQLNSLGGTWTPPPTSDWSCQPSALPAPGPNDNNRNNWSPTPPADRPSGDGQIPFDPTQFTPREPEPTQSFKTETQSPTAWPTKFPTKPPTATPTAWPTKNPTKAPTAADSAMPTCEDDMIHNAAVPLRTIVQTPNTCSANGSKSIYDYICSVKNFSNFCALIRRAGLETLYSGIDGTTQYMTVFAPTNSGCRSSGLGLKKIQSMDIDLAKHIVKTHATEGSHLAEELQCGSDLPTLDGTFSAHSTMCFKESHAKAQYGFFNDEGDYPMILSPNDLKLCNGYIQPVNKMIRVINF